MSTGTITLRHTISRVSYAYEEGYALRLLADPHYGKILEIVDSEKPEVLGQPKIDGVPVDENGDPIVAPVRSGETVVAGADLKKEKE